MANMQNGACGGCEGHHLPFEAQAADRAGRGSRAERASVSGGTRAAAGHSFMVTQFSLPREQRMQGTAVVGSGRQHDRGLCTSQRYQRVGVQGHLLAQRRCICVQAICKLCLAAKLSKTMLQQQHNCRLLLLQAGWSVACVWLYRRLNKSGERYRLIHRPQQLVVAKRVLMQQRHLVHSAMPHSQLHLFFRPVQCGCTAELGAAVSLCGVQGL